MLKQFCDVRSGQPGCRIDRQAACHAGAAINSESARGFRWTFLTRSIDGAATSSERLPGHVSGRTSRLARLEAVLFVADGAMSARRLAQLATLSEAAEARQLIEKLNEAYDHCGSAFRVERVATGYQLLTRPHLSPWLNKLHHRQNELKLSPPAMETLTLVAYRQPVTRADVEAVRGVQCAEMLKQLMERGLVRIGGEEDSLGRPYLYETTRKFLELFGLCSLNDLPHADQLRQLATNRQDGQKGAASEPAEEEPTGRQPTNPEPGDIHDQPDDDRQQRGIAA